MSADTKALANCGACYFPEDEYFCTVAVVCKRVVRECKSVVGKSAEKWIARTR